MRRAPPLVHGTQPLPGSDGIRGAPFNPHAVAGTSLDLRPVPAEERVAAEEYYDWLDMLQFNSKELINNLTQIAGDNERNANGIVFAIERRIMGASPETKLPYLYLLDSIVKNIGRLYVHKFAQNLYNVFRNVYVAASPNVRASLHRLLNTWPGVFGDQMVSALRGMTLECDAAAASAASAVASGGLLAGVGVGGGMNGAPVASSGGAVVGMRIPRVSTPMSLQPSYSNVRNNNTLVAEQMHHSPPYPARMRLTELPRNVVQSAPSVVVPTLDANALSSLVRTVAPRKPLDYNAVRSTSHTAFVRAIYTDLPHLSKSDAMRFATKEDLRVHLDWVFARNRRMRAREKNASGLARCWYPSLSDFLGEKKRALAGAGDAAAATSNAASVTQANTAPQRIAVPARGDDEKCPACREGFNTFWDDDTQAWMIEDAVRNGAQTAFHVRCAQGIDDLDAYELATANTPDKVSRKRKKPDE